MTTKAESHASDLAYVGVCVALAAGLVASRFVFGYPVFHTLAELLVVVIASATFMVVWNSRRYVDNGALVILGITYFFAASVDVLHALAYKGVGLIPGSTSDQATQLWLVARYIQTSAMVIAPLVAARRLRPQGVFVAYALATLAGVTSVLWIDVFPSAFVEGRGLTPFKLVSEYVMTSLMLLGIGLMWRARRHFDPQVLRSLVLSFAFTAAAEVMFTLYTDPFGPANFAGHIIRIVAFVLVYRAIIETALTRPYAMLFTELAQTAEALAESEARFRATFEQASVGIAHVSLSGEWILANRRMAEITGYSDGELMKLTPGQITHPDDLQAEQTGNERLLTGHAESVSVEKRFIRRDGKVVWVRSNRSLVRSADATPQYFADAVEDVSARRQAEARLRHSRDLNEALAAIDRAINSTFDIDEITRRVVAEGGAAIGAESASVVMREGDSWVARHTWHFPTDIIGQRFTRTDVPHAALAADLGEPVTIVDAYADPRVNHEVMKRFGIRSVITIPLTFRGVDIGTLYFNYHSSTHEFDDDEIDFVVKLSSALTLAIQNARMYAIERDTVDTLQRPLLSLNTDIAGIELASAYYSATELTRMGGDFYDVFSLDDGRIAFVIGDVSGKGMEAAAITAVAKSTLRAFAYDRAEPGDVMTAANRALSKQLDESKFITAIYGLLDPGSGCMVFSCAGHPAPIICSEISCATDTIVRNPPLTVFPDLEFESYETTLRPGERMVLFSDGLIDTRRGSDLLGEAGVRGILDDLGDVPPRIAVRVLLEAAQSHAGGQAPDDIAIMAFRYLGLDA